MLIEYKIKVQSDGLTITQRIEGNSAPQAKAGAGEFEQNAVAASAADTEAANAAAARASPHAAGLHHQVDGGAGAVAAEAGGSPIVDQEKGSGGADSGTSPITIIGPIILTSQPHKPGSAESDKSTS